MPRLSAKRSSRVKKDACSLSPLAIAPQSLRRYLRRFSSKTVMVIGDLMLDQYIWGSVSRISPEAPVPIVHVQRESFQLGGAANVFHNILSLGGQAELCGVLGHDDTGLAFRKELAVARQQQQGIILDSTRATTRKARIIAQGQQVVRYDVETCHAVSESITLQIIKHVQARLSSVACLVVSDYAKGVVTPLLMDSIRDLATQQGIPVIVDPKVEHFSSYTGVTVITPNHLEAQQAARHSGNTCESLEDIGHHLCQTIGCEAVLVTRGEQGMSLCEANGESWAIPAMARQVYDVTGAGDTVVSALALSMSAGASLKEGALLANYAAGVAVGLIGTAAITQAQLNNVLDDGVR